MNKEILDALDTDLIERFKTAVELGKWADGQALTDEQKATCMQAIIYYEHQHMAENERTGHVPPKPAACGHESEQTIKWK